MISLPMNPRGASLRRAIVFAIAIALPVLMIVVLGGMAIVGPGLLLLTLPVLVVAGIGGLAPGLLATAIGAAPALLHSTTGAGLEGAGWLVAYLVISIVASFLLGRAQTRIGRLTTERDRLSTDHRFQQAVAELAGDCAWQGHVEGSRLLLDRVTPAFASTLGLSVEDVNTRGGWTALVHADDRATFEEQVRGLTEAGRTSNELRYEVRGALLWLQCEMRALRVEEGGEGVVIGAVRDVTARHELVEQLRQSKDRHEATVIAAGLVLCDVDFTSGRVVFGGNCDGLLGQWPAELSGVLNDWVRRLHPEDAPRFRQALEDARSSGEPLRLEYRVRHADGHYVTVEHGAEPERGDDGEVIRLIGFLRDVSVQRTEQHRLERELQRRLDELRESDRRKDEFLATLAHELRNPLAPIRNASMLLGLQDGNAQSVDWIRRVIDRQTDHLARLIDDLLDVSRLTSDKMTLRLERVELDRVVDNAVDAVRSQIDAQRHRLTIDVPAGLWLQGDQVRLTQVFANLLNNAVKYTSPGGAIEVKAAAEGAWVTVSVRDNGVGIPPDQLAHLFEMFFQVDRSIERAHAGLGIGLTLVERLVRMHGGEVTARSEGIGRGSEFVVRLPLADRPARPEAMAPQPAGRVVRGLRILVADDSVDSALTLTALLSAAGHDVQAVHDGFAALQRAAEFRPQVLVLDIGMPGLNGYDTCRRIRAEPWGRHAVIVAVTGWGSDEDRRRSREAGFDAHLVKPVDYAELQKYFSPDNIAL